MDIRYVNMAIPGSIEINIQSSIKFMVIFADIH